MFPFGLSGDVTERIVDDLKELTTGTGFAGSAAADSDPTFTFSGGADLDSGLLTVGSTYKITARNDADFTTVGSADNNVGTIFTATGTSQLTKKSSSALKNGRCGADLKSSCRKKKNLRTSARLNSYIQAPASPPSTLSTCPVTYLASSEAKKATAAATS